MIKISAGLYIDGANVFFTSTVHTKRLLNEGKIDAITAERMKRLNYTRFIPWVCDDPELTEQRYFNNSAASPQLNQFYDFLTTIGMTVHLREGKRLHDKSFRQSGIDIELAITAMRNAIEWDTLILVTGDADFIPLVEVMLSMGKKVVMVAFSESLNDSYLDMPEVTIKYMDEFYAKYGKEAYIG